ncbi:MAG: DNA cytosine methyltransferase, partial [Alphaproteobacteria bacterium]|nr:DNA cytosine methyltransferase [Alphaproteobacteria bacterium]
KPEFGLPSWQTLHNAIGDLDSADATHIDFPENRLVYYRMLKSGQYWKHLPEELQKQALGKSYLSGGGKTGFLRRLAWDKPSCTLVTHPAMPATDICHPEIDRPLSIQEYKRIQQFPDDWVVCGSLIDQYRQIGNAVPVGLGEAIGRTILAHMAGEALQPPLNFSFSRYKSTDDRAWERGAGRKSGTLAQMDDLFSASGAA